MPAVTIHGPPIATATPATEAHHTARASQRGRAGRAGGPEVGMLPSGTTPWDTLAMVPLKTAGNLIC
jgi:hypothetical protein